MEFQDETARYKGCICYADSTLSVFGYQNPVDPNELGDWWKEIRERENPICQKQDPNLSEVTAPQHINDGDPSVEKAATEWCASMHGQKVKDEVLYNFNIHGLSSFWLSASYRNSAPDGLNCQNEVTISEQDCVKSLMTAVERCEPRQKMTHGAAIGNGCIFYVSHICVQLNRRLTDISKNVTLSGLTDPDHPPWEGDKGKPKCDDKVSNIERTFFAGITPQFCSQVKGEAIKKTLTNKDFQQPSKGKRSPPPSGTQYEGFKFNFEFSGSDEENCETSCDDSFQEILSACTGQSTMRYKGSLDTGCGTYSYSIEDPPPPPPPKEATCKPFGVPEYLEPYINCDKCRNPTAGYSKSAFQAAAHQNCYGGYEWIAVQDNEDSVYNYGWFDTTTTDTSTNLPTFCLGMTHDKGTWQPDTFSDCKAQGNMGADSKIAFAVVPAKIQDGCKPLRDYELPKDGTCTGIIDKVITDCITGNEEDETGGYYLDKSENGCWEWWIWGISN
jgi:hypothetical protein